MAEPETCDLFVIGGGINARAWPVTRRARASRWCWRKGRSRAGNFSSRPQAGMVACAISNIGEFAFVREAPIEREVLLNAAPHIIWPMRFVLPHSPQDRPARLVAWLVSL